MMLRVILTPVMHSHLTQLNGTIKMETGLVIHKHLGRTILMLAQTSGEILLRNSGTDALIQMGTDIVTYSGMMPSLKTQLNGKTKIKTDGVTTKTEKMQTYV